MPGTHRDGLVVLLLIVFAGLQACGGSPTRWSDAAATHVVRSGETLFGIAWRYGKDPADLARWNRLGDGSLIFPGQLIRLTPPKGAAAPRRTGTAAAKSRPLPRMPQDPPPDWVWPADGPISVGFGGVPGPGTGILIDGKKDQPIRAAANGRVVYAGSGLIGYGKLIIVKHNDTYLSAYGYTASLLVEEGAEITSGQPIATMGEGPERKARLHFEIRRNGKPVNPREFLPAR